MVIGDANSFLLLTSNNYEISYMVEGKLPKLTQNTKTFFLPFFFFFLGCKILTLLLVLIESLLPQFLDLSYVFLLILPKYYIQKFIQV